MNLIITFFILVVLYKIIIFSIDFPDLYTKSVENDSIYHLLPKPEIIPTKYFERRNASQLLKCLNVRD